MGLVFLYETLAHHNKVEEVRKVVGYNGCFSINRIGRSGGVTILWKNSLDCVITSYSKNHINMEVKDEKRGNWRINEFYGMPKRADRKNSWDLIQSIYASSNHPLCLIGDINDMVTVSDKKGGATHSQWLLDGVREVISDCGLLDF